MNTLSVAATFGVLVWVFQDGHLASLLDVTPTGFIDVFTPMLNSNSEPRKELFVSDGLHLNAAGYELWASIIRPYLNR